MPKIKICGLTREEDIENVNLLLPDYIGFVFWAESKRNVTEEKAALLKDKLDTRIKAVGVFVDADTDLIAGLFDKGIIDIAQLHGTEDDIYIGKLRDEVKLMAEDSGSGGREFRIIKAFNVNRLASFEDAENSSADYIMMDPGKGSGVAFDYSRLEALRRPYFLAGGLTPENVGDAVRKMKPFALDVSSGVEKEGLKDRDKMTAFMNAAYEGAGHLI
ncbi:MAG: phosphoribosylanthranilate isomerase [Eubacterium sp.]|nr:phosphoribosylanthranilate isomerase [Eubacterium sp.]